MKKQKFAILDMEEEYACSLMEYLADRQSMPFETLVFGSVEGLAAYARQETVDLLLVSARMMCDEIRSMDIRRIVVLSEGGTAEESGGYPSVYKYQSSESLVAEVMNCYARQELLQPVFTAKKDVEVIGVYSPVGRCGKTCFALALGQILAGSRRVLYINMEDYAGFDTLLERESMSDLSDVMYFLRQNRGNVIMKLNSAVQRIGDMDYIPPAPSSQDLREIRAQEWVRLLEDLVSYSSYQVIILDIGQPVGEVFSLLAQCSVVYTPVCGDAVSDAKIAQYERLLHEQDFSEVLQKTQKLMLPLCVPAMRGEYFLSQLTAGEMGAYVRGLLRQEAGYDPGTGGI